ncbi:helix-turn-helix transcriptional regulator [Kitasatospora sp. NPDC086791]|uniref:helix-turn-helix domain-containing protein n=1 Tax=Kitasatospora sp. NPDC086791 TaxID=3155178 RepID=UPI00341FEFFF
MRADDHLPNLLQQERWAVGSRLRSLRRERGLSQVQLQALSGVDNKTISRVENGHRNVGLDELVRLSLALGVPTWRLLRDP